MLNWFQYQLKHQRSKGYQDKHVVDPICNIAAECHDMLHQIKNLYFSSRTTKKIESIFSPAAEYRYVDVLASNVPELPKSTLEEWIHDPMYSILLDRPSHEAVYFHEQEDFDNILAKFCRAMNIKKYRSKGLTSLKLHVLHPGHMFPLHFDRPQNFDFDQRVSRTGENFRHKRFFLFLDDQKPGQIFQIDHACIRWKAGDVFDYDQKNDMHGGANFGYWPRHMLMITILIEDTE